MPTGLYSVASSKLHFQHHVTCILEFPLWQLSKFDFSKFRLHFEGHVTVFDWCQLAFTVLQDQNCIFNVTWRVFYNFRIGNCL